jgi:hypothetical protein
MGIIAERTTKTYSMKETMAVAKSGMVDIEKFLSSFPSSIAVVNVEDHPAYRKKDIDLLWIYLHKGNEQMKRIELKVDRYTSGNFFFETASNVAKGTDGCFMYTEADYLFYYFQQWKKLYVLPVEEVRAWFVSNEERFTEKSLGTKIGDKQVYSSKGKLVPIKTVITECPGVKCHQLK